MCDAVLSLLSSIEMPTIWVRNVPRYCSMVSILIYLLDLGAELHHTVAD